MIHFIKINPLHLLLPILASSVFLSCKDDLTIAIQPVPGSDDEVLVELPIELEDSEDGYALSADNTPTRATDNGSAMDVPTDPRRRNPYRRNKRPADDSKNIHTGQNTSFAENEEWLHHFQCLYRYCSG